MSHDPQDISPIFQMDVGTSHGVPGPTQQNETSESSELNSLLQQLVVGQERQNELLEEMVEQMHASQKQRSVELGQWKDANPILARRCRAAAEALSQVQTEFLHKITCDVSDNFENMIDGDFVMNEFVDRYGPRLAHLNGVLQMLSQLSASTPH